jgi:histidinol-phosphate aminotransferase
MTAIRLHYNENTAGCSPTVIAALSALTVNDIATYASDDRVRSAIATWFGIDGDMVLPVNGLDEGLLLAAQRAALLCHGYEAIVVEPAFEMYAAVVAATGGVVRRVRPAPGFQSCAQRVLDRASARTRLVFLCDPNNPTGLATPRADIEAIADAMPHALILVDEAYADFSGRSLIGGGFERWSNVVVGRTFAKAHGLAGLRVGALVASPALIGALRRLALPYRINVAAAAALDAALADRAHFTATIAGAAAARAHLIDECRRLDLTTWPSEANFVLVRVGDHSTECAAWLAARGVLVRDRSMLPGCAGCLRITTMSMELTRLAVSLLEEWHASRAR